MITTKMDNEILLSLLLISLFSTNVIFGQCPSPNGFFPNEEQCDKYLACVDNVAIEKLCPDGLVFNSKSPLYERCDLPFRANCQGRELRQTPQPSENCQRQNGLFPHENSGNCTHFWSCEKGTATSLHCPDGLVFHEANGACEWPDVAQRSDCEPEAFLQFDCLLSRNQQQLYEHPRFPHPKDCRKFYICLYGHTPRLLHCPEQDVFNGNTLHCDHPENVAGCENYYEVLTQ